MTVPSMRVGMTLKIVNQEVGNLEEVDKRGDDVRPLRTCQIG